MNDLQFAILASFAGRPGVATLPDNRETTIALAGLIDKGLLRGGVLRDEIGRAVGATPLEATFDGLAALAEEERLRLARSSRARIGKALFAVAFCALGAAFAAAANTLFARWLGPKPICERPCECRTHDKSPAQGYEPTAPLVDEKHAVKRDGAADGQ